MPRAPSAGKVDVSEWHVRSAVAVCGLLACAPSPASVVPVKSGEFADANARIIPLSGAIAVPPGRRRLVIRDPLTAFVRTASCHGPWFGHHMITRPMYAIAVPRAYSDVRFAEAYETFAGCFDQRPDTTA